MVKWEDKKYYKTCRETIVHVQEGKKKEEEEEDGD